MSITIQNFILYPHSLELSHLYIRGNNYYTSEENSILYLKEFSSIAFDTYYNFFAIQKWNKYTTLDSIFLEFEFSGDLQINIIGLNERNTFYQYEKDLYQERLLSEKTEEFTHYKVRVDQFKDNSAIYLAIRANQTECKIRNIRYTTDSDFMAEEFKLGCCICTYNRPTYVQKSVDILEKGIEENGLNLGVYITNNGDDLFLNNDKSYIHVYKSKNRGGAGGFTHSMVRAKQDSCSHILLMDDDINFHFEAILRTYRFFYFLKQEYFDVVLSGAMCSSDERWLQYERNSLIDNNGFHAQGHFQDIRDRRIALENSIAQSIHGLSGWWFSVFSAKLIEDYGLPLPVFVRGDDIEYSMRLNREIVSINGVHVWHDPFILKYNEVMEDYYLPRNMVINSLLSYQRYYGLIKLFILRKFLRNLFAYNYIAAEFNLLAMKHILDGTYMEDPYDVHQWITAKMKELRADVKIYENQTYSYTNPRFHHKLGKLFGLLLSFVGLGNIGTSKYGFERHPRFFIGRKKVLVFNTLSNTMEDAVLDRKKMISLSVRFVKQYFQLQRNKEKLRFNLLKFRETAKTFEKWNNLFKT